MRTFKDNAGRTWSLSVDCDCVRRVRTALNFNLVNADFKAMLDQLLGDPVFLCDVLYVVCKPEADRQNLSDVDFGRAMYGDCIEQGTMALLEELANFTPSHRDRARIQKLLNAMWTLAEKSHDVRDRQAQTAIDQILTAPATTSGPSSGVSPETSASIPAP